MIQTVSKYEIARHSFRKNFSEGIKPVDSRQPIPDKLALQMIQELDVSKDALIGVYDAFLILTTHLIEAGYRNIVVLENTYKNLSQSQEKYYNSVESVCVNSGIKYYIPPMNNWSRCNMKFDVIIGNPPYSNKQSGDRSGSSSNTLWKDITKVSLSLLKNDGILSFITPTTIVSGSEEYTSIFLGKEAKYDLNYVDFSADDYFSVGIQICRWVAKNRPSTHSLTVNDGRKFDPTKIDYLSKDVMIDSIFHALYSHPGEKLRFNQSNRYDYNAVSRYLEKKGLPIEWSKDLRLDKDDIYCYPVANNDKIKYSRVSWKDAGVWRVFAPQFTGDKNQTFWIDDQMSATGTTWTHRCNSKEEAERILSIVDCPEYKWIINKIKVNGRITGKIRSLPAEFISNILSTEQLNYIKEQLK